MDPIANLQEQLNLSKEILRLCDVADDEVDVTEDLEFSSLRLAQLVLALDEWICGGGFLPPRWERKP